MFRPVIAAGAVVPLLALSASCSNGVSRDDFVESFQLAHPEASTIQSQCVVDDLLADYDLDGLEREMTAVPVASSFEYAQFRSMFRCGLTNDLKTQIAAQLAESDIDPAAAECAATSLTDALDEADLDVLLEGEITDAFYDKYFVALDACNGLP